MGTVEPDPLCERCGRPITGRHHVGRRRVYCGQACRQRAYEERNAFKRIRITAPEDVVQRVAGWLAKEYGELLPDASDGYWEFQAREVVAVALVGVAF